MPTSRAPRPSCPWKPSADASPPFSRESRGKRYKVQGTRNKAGLRGGEGGGGARINDVFHTHICMCVRLFIDSVGQTNLLRNRELEHGREESCPFSTNFKIKKWRNRSPT